MKHSFHRKKWMLGLALLLAAAAEAGCGGRTNETSPAQAESSTALRETADIPNPMKEVGDVNAFEKLGIHMVVPDGAKDVRYYLINGEVADIRLTMDGVNYTWRASNTAQDFSGIFQRFKENPYTLNYDYGTGTLGVLVKTTESGGRLAEWTWGDTAYTLYTAGSVEDDVINAVILKLAELSQYEK